MTGPDRCRGWGWGWAQASGGLARNSALPALFFIGIDHFKPINHVHNQAAGTPCSRPWQPGWHACVRQSDTVRHGGDAFLVLLPELMTQPDDALPLGIYPRDAGSAEALTACADRAMHLAKAGGGGQVVEAAGC